CILVLRAPFWDAPMALASRRVLGQPYDSPNFQVAYNALLAMDIYPDVIMESEASWKVWTHDSLDEALNEVKDRLDIVDDTSHDIYLKEMLSSRLTPKDGKWVWPRGNRSALIHWEV
ncbi:MAG: SAM-dependent methyltransferase, partial [Desulfobacterales bacterium]|nr:SAM-dependent methyltransferase [Desulfobacterales bacterium]